MVKNLDGIKKINSAEVKHVREKKPGLLFFSKMPKKVDGLNLMVDKEKLERERLKQAIKEQAEARKKAKAENKEYLLEQVRQAKTRRLEEREKIEEQKQAKRALEQKKWREKLELAEKERLARKIIEEAEKLARKQEKEKKRLKRRQARAEFKKNLKLKIGQAGLYLKRNLIYFTLLPIIFLVLTYLLFALAVLKFNRYEIVKQASRYLALPAVISTKGIISYADFQNLKTDNYAALSLKDKKNKLLEWLISASLKRKYGSINNLEDKFMADEDFNQAAFLRVKKIESLLSAGQPLDSLAKYADEYDSDSLFTAQAAADKFGPEILNLSLAQVSQPIFRANGYYLVKRLEAQNGQLALAYLFVVGQSFEEYLKAELKNSKIFILAD